VVSQERADERMNTMKVRVWKARSVMERGSLELLSRASGHQAVQAPWIDLSHDDAPLRLEGEALRAWLVQTGMIGLAKGTQRLSTSRREATGCSPSGKGKWNGAAIDGIHMSATIFYYP